MKRLKNKLLSMDLNTTTYTEMYNGSMTIIEPNSSSYEDWNPTYYREDIGYEIQVFYP